MNDGEYIKYHQLLGTWFSWLLTNYSVHKKCKSVVPKSYGPLSVAFGFSENADLDDSVILHLFFFSSRTNLKCNISAHLKLVEKLIT